MENTKSEEVRMNRENAMHGTDCKFVVLESDCPTQMITEKQN